MFCKSQEIHWHMWTRFLQCPVMPNSPQVCRGFRLLRILPGPFPIPDVKCHRQHPIIDIEKTILISVVGQIPKPNILNTEHLLFQPNRTSWKMKSKVTPCFIVFLVYGNYLVASGIVVMWQFLQSLLKFFFNCFVFSLL